MVVRSNEHYLIKSSPRQIRRLYHRYHTLTGKFGSPSSSISTEDMKSEIETYITKSYNNEKSRNDLFYEMNEWVKQHFLSKNDTKWLEDSERATYWAWLTLKMSNSIITSTAGNHEARFEQVLDFVDSCYTNPSKMRDQLSLATNKWSEIYTAPKPLSWLKPKNENQLLWVWNYLNTPLKPLEFALKPNTLGLKPASNHELYLAIIAACDVWEAPASDKKLFYIHINSAWHQKKHRDNLEGRVQCNFTISTQAKEWLDALSEEQDKSRNKIIEELIDEKYHSLRSI